MAAVVRVAAVDIGKTLTGIAVADVTPGSGSESSMEILMLRVFTGDIKQLLQFLEDEVRVHWSPSVRHGVAVLAVPAFVHGCLAFIHALHCAAGYPAMEPPAAAV
jgi:hypothetical protein